MKTAIAALLGAAPALVAALALGGAGGSRLEAADPAAPTFSREVAPILQRRCQSCHRPGEVAPMSLLGYDEVRPYAQSIKEEVLARRMPPWHAGPDSVRFSNDPTLAKEELEALVGWVDGGAPEGDPKDLPPPLKFIQGWGLGTPDQVFSMPEEHEVPASGEVAYQYFRIPTGFTEDRWITALEVRPGNPAVVHHILVFFVPPARRQEDGKGRERARPRGIDWKNYLGGMVPGGGPVRLPEGTAKRIPAGSTLLFQVHYTPNGKPAVDRSRVGFLFARGSVEKEAETRIAINMAFLIPPGAASVPVSSEYKFSRDSRLLALMPHMHLRGKSFEYRAVFPDGTEKLLLSVPRYDFNWQHTYRLAEPMVMPKGTMIRCSATFDNSAANKSNPDPTKLVHWGDQTWEEMMIGFIGFYRERVEEPGAGKRRERL